MSQTTICPTVLAPTTEEYSRQISRISQFATRIHIDLADGQFAPTKTVAINQVWWPAGVRADLHVMYQKPFEFYKDFLALGPQMVIVHAESDGNFLPFAELMHRHGIEVGVALKASSPAEMIRPAIEVIYYVLIFSGDLGHFGGQADLSLLSKVKVLKQLKSRLEIGWDGGITNANARELARGGVDVLNVGGFIQQAADPRMAYGMLSRAVV